MKYFLVFLLLTTTGCTAQYRAERDLARYGPYCETLGFEKGSQAFANCIQNERANAIRGYGAVTQ